MYSDCLFDVHQIVKLEEDARNIKLKPNERNLNQWEMTTLKSCQVYCNIFMARRAIPMIAFHGVESIYINNKKHFKK